MSSIKVPIEIPGSIFRRYRVQIGTQKPSYSFTWGSALRTYAYWSDSHQSTIHVWLGFHRAWYKVMG